MAGPQGPGGTLHSFQDRVQDVPQYLRRHLALIRDLDEKVVELQQEIEQQARRKPSGRQGDQPPYDPEPAITRLLSLADEKVTIAAQIYDFVDKHIQYLDFHLKALGDTIDEEKGKLGMGRGESACAAAGVRLEKSQRRQGGRGADTERQGKRKVRKADRDDDHPITLAHPPSEHEPLYCFCQRPSHGNMVACDNDECAHEWFHYECVGLTEAPSPDQEWYCPECASTLSIKQRQGGG